MTKTAAAKLSDLVDAVKALPEVTQEALLGEADPEKVREFFARYGVTPS